MSKRNPSHPIRWFHEVSADGAVTLRRGKQGDRLVAEWPGIATLTCRRDGSASKLVPAVGISHRKLDKLRGGAVNALLRDLAGQLAFHASAVAVDHRAVLFLGDSGAGKSTAAAEMCLRHGAQLLADDVALVEIGPAEVNVLPSEDCHWLTRESCVAIGLARSQAPRVRDKRRIRASNLAAGPCPLALVVALCLSPALRRATLRPVRGGDAARLLFAATTRFDIEDSQARQREFNQVTAVYRRARFLELVRPAAAPGEVAQLIVRALEMGMQ